MISEVLYITSHHLPSNTAHSLQIIEMSKAFNSCVNFKLISPLNNLNKKKSTFFKWNKIQVNLKNKFLFKMVFFLKIFYFFFFNNKDKIIFTRNIDIAFLCFFFKHKFIFEIHQSPQLIGRIILSSICRKPNFYLITISESLKKFLNTKYNFLNKIASFHDGVDINKYKRLHNFTKKKIREKLKLDNKKTYLLYTGSIYKGLSIDEIESIFRQFKNLNIILIGATESEKKKILKQIKKKNFLVLGRMPSSKVAFYQVACDYLILPIKKKGSLWWCSSPLKLFEYMASKNLIISSGIGSISEVLNNKNSIIYSNNIIDGINSALKIKDKKLINQAFIDVVKNYTWKIRVKKILEILKIKNLILH